MNPDTLDKISDIEEDFLNFVKVDGDLPTRAKGIRQALFRHHLGEIKELLDKGYSKIKILEFLTKVRKLPKSDYSNFCSFINKEFGLTSQYSRRKKNKALKEDIEVKTSSTEQEVAADKKVNEIPKAVAVSNEDVQSSNFFNVGGQ